MNLLIQIKEKKVNWFRDIYAGVIVALVSIPISMGYAQIAGLPVVYGLYGSLLPILVYGFLTTSVQFVVGVDAMPAVMVGSLAAGMGIAAESEEALNLAPVMAMLTALWFVVFYVFRAGRVVKFISTPVMGGFISGVGLTIILMQVPKLFGGVAGTGEIVVLIRHILAESSHFHLLSFVLGMFSFLVILACKKWAPRLPMTVIMIGVGAFLQYFFRLDAYGVKLLPEVTGGLPRFALPDWTFFSGQYASLLVQSLSIAAVIMAQTLLATGNYAMQHQDTIDNNQELLAYAGMNLISGVTGACPINGSVSRSGIVESLGGRSQIVSVSASASMLLVLLFATPVLKYLPVPVLTGIVMTALWGILDFRMMKRLWKTQKSEWIVFMVALGGVLLFGTVNGVLIGVLLSFWEVAVRAVNPSVSFMGCIPGKDTFYTLERNKTARPIRNTVIYRFNGNLFFANIDKFQQDIENALKEDTKAVIVDARGVGNIDITAVDRLLMLYQSLQKRGIAFYITEHDGSINDLLRKTGGARLLEEGAVRRTIPLALRDLDMERPYALEQASGKAEQTEWREQNVRESADRLPEFEWLFGQEAEAKMEELAHVFVKEMTKPGADVNALERQSLDGHGVQTAWGMLGLYDEETFLDYLEILLTAERKKGNLSKELEKDMEEHIEKRRLFGEGKLDALNPYATEMVRKHRQEIREHIRTKYPDAYAHFEKLHPEE